MALPGAVDASALPDATTEEVPVVEDEIGPRRRFWRRRNILIVIASVVVAAGAGVGVWLGTSGSGTPVLQITTQTVAVTTGTMKQTVSTSGTIAPASQANLDFAVSGKVTAVDVTAGQAVTAGQVLATVDPAALQATLDAAQASLTSAQARLSSDESSSASTSQIDSDKASVTSAQSQLTSAQTDLNDASLTSTIAGTVASVDLTVGQQVSGSGSGGSNSPASGGSSGGASTSASSSSSSAQVVVISTDSYVVTATVDDTQVGQVKPGDQVTITPSGSTTTVYGTVSSVGLIASAGSGVATFPVDIAVTGTPSGLYAGSTATLSIIVKELNTVLEVPTAAISYSGGKAEVTVVEQGKHVTRSVTTGEVSNGETQITAGLSAGDKVVERVVKFNGTTGGGRSLLGGGGATGGLPGGGSFPGGGFPGGGRFSRSGAFGG